MEEGTLRPEDTRTVAVFFNSYSMVFDNFLKNQSELRKSLYTT